jgi:AcrR family transcriptional regulator
MVQRSAADRLIASAEQLFAERGIGAVSLRQINLAAGHRNVSAAHYHFGSQQRLIEAVIERRMEGINARRLALLDELEEGGLTGDLHAVVSAMVCPLAEQLGEGPRGSYYIRLLSRVYGDPSIRIAETFRGRHGQSVLRIEQLVHEILVELPRQIVAMRLALATGQMIHALADWERHTHGATGRVSAAETALHVSNLIDSIVGSLCAPVSQETHRELQTRRRRRGKEAG